MTTRRPPAAKRTGASVRKGAHKPQRPARLKCGYEDDDDSFDVPEPALGGAKE